MERWVCRVAVVTGASSGIDAAVVKHLANNGMVTIGLARRVERVENHDSIIEGTELREDACERLHAIKCDVRDEKQVTSIFKDIEKKFGPISVLVNNAGVLRPTTLLKEDNSQDIRDTIDTNIMGVVYATREAFRQMKASGCDGHIFLINSIVGHKVPLFVNNTLNIYPPTKYAISAMTEIYRQELLKHRKIKVTSISPGIVDTEIISEDLKSMVKDIVYLKPDDIAEGLIYCLQTPPHVQVHEMTIKPVGEMM